MTECPWVAVDGFYGQKHFERFLLWMDEQVRLGIAREVPRDEAVMEGKLCDQKWYVHLPSGDVWRVIWPNMDGRSELDGAFSPVRWTPEPARYRREKEGSAFQPFWRTGDAWEEDVIKGVEFNDFMAWMLEQIASGKALEFPVPEAVNMRSSTPQRWFMHVPSGQTWQLLLSESGPGGYFRPLELPESLKAFLPVSGSTNS